MDEQVSGTLTDVRGRCVHPPLVTVAAIAAVLGTGIRYHVFSRELPLDVAFRYGFSGRALSMGHWGTLVTSQFLTRNAFMAVSIALSLALMLGLYEMIAGSTRAAVVTVVSAFVGPLLVAGALGIGSSLGAGFASRTLTTLDYGASAVTAGAGGALVAVLGMRRVRWFAIAWVIGGLILHHQLADWEHLGSFAVGSGIGRAFGAPAIGSLRWFHRLPSNVKPAAAVTVALAVAVATGVGLGGAALTGTSNSRVLQVSYPTPSLGGTRNAFVVLPVGYDASRRRYPVVEMLHGKPGSPGDILTGFNPVEASTLPGMPAFIGVVPDGHGPVVSDGAFADTAKQRLGTAVSDDLQRWVNRKFRTDRHWGVTGLSDGGYGAAYLGSRLPPRYDSVCALSGNFTPQGSAFTRESTAVLRAANPLANAHRGGPRTLLIAGASDRTSVREMLSYARALRQAGQAVRSVIPPGGHDWHFWHRQFPNCLRFILAPTSPTSPTGAVQTRAANLRGTARPASY